MKRSKVKQVLKAGAKVFLLSSLTLAVLSTGCTKKKAEVLTVGMELAYPPFETKDDKGNPSGISVDLAYAMGEHLGREVKIENLNWDGLIPSLQTNKVDVIISSMTITEERSKVVDFSDPYANSYLALLTNADAEINTVEDLNQIGKVVAVKKGTTGAIFADKFLGKATVNALSSENACVTEVVQGKSHAFIYDQLTIYRQSQKNPDTTKAVFIPAEENENGTAQNKGSEELLKATFIPAQKKENWGMALKKGNEALLKQVNEFIKKYKEEGGFEKLTEKYMAEEKKVFDELNFPWFFE